MPPQNRPLTPPLPPLPRGEIHIWQRTLSLSPAQTNEYNTLLSEDEQQRAKRFRFDKHRIAFIAARSTLRTLLGHYLNTPPQDLRFCYNPQGKPNLEETKPPLYFNISHSGQWGMYAITLETALGIDLEIIRPKAPKEYLDIARRFFSHEEFTTLSRLPETEINTAFFTCWTRKEAYIKCHGLGLSLPLSKFTVSMDPKKPAHILATPWCPEDLTYCQMHDLPAPSGYRAALALASRNPISLRYFQ